MLLIESQCFPPVITFVLLKKYDGILIERYENYQKRSYRNRMYIGSAQGTQSFTIPLKSGKNAQLPVTEVLIAYDEDWPLKINRLLQTNYGNAPFYEYYIDSISQILNATHNSLYELNMASLHWALKVLGLAYVPEETTEYVQSYNENDDIIDMRGQILPNRPQSENLPHYGQVYEEEYGYIQNLSILDLVFCLGPEASIWLAEAAGQ